MKPIYLFATSSHPNAKNITSLSITFLTPQIDFSKYDYLIITSKQVAASLKLYQTQEYLSKPALCVSTASAKSYEEIGGTIVGIGSGYGDTLIDKIKALPKSKKWVYLRANIVASDFVGVCKNDGYDIDEEIVYKTQCSQNILDAKVADDAIFIFTSPSSVNCFLQTHQLTQKAKIVVIGKTTAKALPEGLKYTLSQTPTVDSCMEIASKL